MENHPKYKFYKQMHPEWSEDQIRTAVGIDMSAENEISRAGSDVDPNDPDLIRKIIEGARSWLSEVLPQVFERVKSFFDQLINTMSSWVKKGLQYVVDFIGSFPV